MRFNAIVRHKHSTKTAQFIFAPILFLAVLAAFSVHHNALAFSLPPKITPALLFAGSPSPSPSPAPSYMSTMAVAAKSPVTTEGAWKTEAPVRTRTNTAIARQLTTGPVVLEGIASYYSKAGCLGCNPLFVMANGQVLDDNALTMAIGADRKHLVGYNARVTNLANGKSVIVRITDTGGFYKDKYGNRVADLTIGTKEAIGMRGGLGKVRVEVL